jgi:putative transposase
MLDVHQTSTKRWNGSAKSRSSGRAFWSATATAFTAAFDEVFRSEAITVIRAPIAAPRAKAHAERWVGSLRRECLDRILIVSGRHLERVLHEYLAHHNAHRPHRSLAQHPPIPKPPPLAGDDRRVRRCDRLGGLLHEHELAA